MNSRLIHILIIFAMLLPVLPGCARKTDVFETGLNILGTFAQVSIAGLTPEQAQEATRQAEQSLESLDHIGYTFGAGGELQRVNEALANGRTIAVSSEMINLLTRARELSLASGRLFNPAAGELTALWEFHCDREACDTPPPYPDEVQKLVEEKLAGVLKRAPSMDDLVIRGDRVSSRNRQVSLEFGDAIRGLALDLGIRSLRQAGAANAMIDIGGSVHTTGTRGDHAWWIGIPDATGKHLVGSIETGENESVVTVRALDKSFDKQGLIYRRIIDPRNGQPVSEFQSVTVIHSSAMVANAAATAFLIAGSKDWKRVADRMDVHALLVVTQDGTIYTSPAIDHRIHWKQGITHQHLVP
ncbi:MAG TPA: FAD:protein FMN transferase [Gammaproteobacteria bacterium]|nr:FAD:protein FMN transferase [Gammaproteobacteria bacterium]